MLFVNKDAELVFEGEIVGYRISKNGKQFDISKDIADLLIEDELLTLEEHKQARQCTMVERGNNIVAPDLPPANEMKYKDCALMLGREDLAKTDVELKKIYNYWNKKAFDGHLKKDMPIFWSSRMTSVAGCYMHSWKMEMGLKHIYNQRIKISTHYAEKFPDDVLNVIVHEMIHAYMPNEHHGAPFKEKAKELSERFGLNIRIYSHGAGKINYIYGCSSCHKTFDRAKRINLNRYHCTCGGKLYLHEDLRVDS